MLKDRVSDGKARWGYVGLFFVATSLQMVNSVGMIFRGYSSHEFGLGVFCEWWIPLRWDICQVAMKRACYVIMQCIGLSK